MIIAGFPGTLNGLNVLSASSARPLRRSHRFGALALAIGLVVAGAGCFVLARALALRNDVLPRVSVAGVDVGGLGEAEARARLAVALTARLDRPVVVRIGPRTLRIRPGAVYELDAFATVSRAYAMGRESFWERLRAVALPFGGKHEVEPVLRERSAGPAALSAKLESVTRRPVSARVTMDGLEPVVRSGSPGIAVDEAALARSLLVAGLGGQRSIRARLVRAVPELTTKEAQAAAAQASLAVSAPVTVGLGDSTLGDLSVPKLARTLRFQPVGGAYQVVLDSDSLARALQPLIRTEIRQPVDAKFELVGDRVRVTDSRGGTKLAAARAAESVLAAALSDSDRTAWLDLTKAEADLTTREAKALGIHEQISTYTTDMGPSSSNRIHNVHLMGELLDGTIVRPGETFSFNRVVGPRTPERGFLEGQMIFAGVLIPSIGGGVCQTGTTIFNAAFEAGLPILERTNHSFYISHYPMGRDATVSWGGPDLVFKNDLEHPILLHAEWTDETFTVSLFGTGQDRSVVSETSKPQNFTQPKLQYAIDPTAPPTSVRTTDGGGPGFDVNVHRKVFEGGRLLREDDFRTRYTPENPTRVYGTRANAPAGAFVLPTTG
jgi:vancomycin resistance protein YoaR